MKIYVIKRRGSPCISYRGVGRYCSTLLDAVLYNQPELAFSALRDLKTEMEMSNDALDVFVAELEFTEQEVNIGVVPVSHRSGFQV